MLADLSGLPSLSVRGATIFTLFPLRAGLGGGGLGGGVLEEPAAAVFVETGVRGDFSWLSGDSVSFSLSLFMCRCCLMLVLAGLGGGRVAKLPLHFVMGAEGRGGLGLTLPPVLLLSAVAVVMSSSVGGTPLVVGVAVGGDPLVGVALVGCVVPPTFCDLALAGLGGRGFVTDWEGKVAAPPATLLMGNAESAPSSCVCGGLPEVTLPVLTLKLAGFGLVGGRGLLNDPPRESSELVLEPVRVTSKPLPLSLFC